MLTRVRTVAAIALITVGLCGVATLYTVISPSAKPKAVLVLVHGGAWVSGSASGLDLFAEYAQRAGYATTSVEYTTDRAQAPTLPIVLGEIHQAVSQAARQNPDTPIMIVGVSAGAHLALLYAYQHPTTVSTVVAVTPITDLDYWYQTAGQTWVPLQALLGPDYTLADCVVASPSTYLPTPGHAPYTLMVSASDDTTCPAESNAAFLERLRVSHAIYSSVSIPGKHGLCGQYPAIVDAINAIK